MFFRFGQIVLAQRVCVCICYRSFTGISFVGPNQNRLNSEKRGRFAILKGLKTIYVDFVRFWGSQQAFIPIFDVRPHETDIEIRGFLDRLVWRKSRCRPTGARGRASESLTGKIKRAPNPRLTDGRGRRLRGRMIYRAKRSSISRPQKCRFVFATAGRTYNNNKNDNL